MRAICMLHTLHACHMHAACVLHAYYMHVTHMSHACSLCIACALHDYNMQATCMGHACDTPNKVDKTCMRE